MLRRDRGFTLIELLLVLVIMGILMAVLIPRWANSRERAFTATMKSDLRNLATAEESYFYDNSTYATNLSALTAYSPSTGITVTINSATVAGWAATASRPGLTQQCYLFVGNATPPVGTLVEGQVSCQ